MSFDLTIRAGYAASKDNFCVALHSRDDEDPYSIILVYNDNRENPWNRFDVNRNIYDIAYIKSEKRFAALSNQGNIYLIDFDGNIVQEEVDNVASTMRINVVNDTLFVTGFRDQFFKREGDGKWNSIILPKLEGAFKSIDYFDVGGTNLNNLYIAGIANPPDNVEQNALLLEQSAEARVAGDDELADKLWEQAYDNEPESIGIAYYLNDNEWEELDVDIAKVDTIFVDSRGSVFFGTRNSGILHGNGEDGFDDLETAKNIISITKLGKKIIFIAGSGLFTFVDKENTEVKPLKIKTSKGKAPLPLKIQAVDGVLICFDFNLGVYMWDGDKKWTNIPIPPELLERDFKGLK